MKQRLQFQKAFFQGTNNGPSNNQRVIYLNLI